MLKDVGCTYVIVGHSERRTIYREDDALVARKFLAVQAQEVHAHIRAEVAARDANIAARLQVLYGGSVKAGNAKEIFAMPDVDGGLIGGASLKADEFLKICAAAQAH
jgi:triosephosphate isomerase